MNPREFLLENLPLIEQITKSVCRGRSMDAGETEDFASFVHVRLVENDYAIIRKFQGRSSLGTYLSTVVSRLLYEYLEEEWGRWRSSAEAKRLGPIAMDIERLIHRDNRSPDEAFATITSAYPELERAEFDRISARLPFRVPRKLVALQEASSVSQKPDVSVHDRDSAERLSSVVVAYIEALPEEDRLILQLRFEQDVSVPQIAQSLHLDAQMLYRRLRRHFEELRNILVAKGISASEATELIGGDELPLDFHLKRVNTESLNDEYDTGNHTIPKKP